MKKLSIIEILNEDNLNNNLTSIANILREKRNISTLLNFPTDFISNVNNLYVVNDLLDLNKPVGEIYTTINSIKDEILRGRKKITKIFATNATVLSSSCL